MSNPIGTAYAALMITIGSRARSQAPPPHVLLEALTHPDRETARTWLILLDDEHPPRDIRAVPPHTVVWSSLWTNRPDAMIEFGLSPGAGGTSLSWTLRVDDPAPDEAMTGHLRRRMNELINRDLRYSFGQ